MSIDFISFYRVIKTKGDDSTLIVKNVNTEVSGSITISLPQLFVEGYFYAILVG